MWYAQMVYMLPSVYNSWKLLHYILVNVVPVSSIDFNGNGQGYKTIQDSFVNKYINSYSTFGSMNVQVGMQVVIPAQWQWICFNMLAQWQS